MIEKTAMPSGKMSDSFSSPLFPLTAGIHIFWKVFKRNTPSATKELTFVQSYFKNKIIIYIRQVKARQRSGLVA